MSKINILYELINSKSIQDFINKRFNDKKSYNLPIDEVEYIVTKTGFKFLSSSNVITSIIANNEYKIDDIRNDDIVIDIGACIGGFCIPASVMSNRIYAIEPIVSDCLIDNIKLNNVSITVFDKALGDGNKQKISWNGVSKVLNTLTLNEIKKICGGCDFLKCDAEGAEWLIDPRDLVGIRRIEMEVHPSRKHKFVNMLDLLNSLGFRCTFNDKNDAYMPSRVIHAYGDNNGK